MTELDTQLTSLRREIDEIDQAMHDLLMRRAELVERIRGAKTGERAAVWRPAREAQVLRRLLARHRGAFSRATLVRIWREIMSEFVRMQAPFAVAVVVPADRPELLELARDHFGQSATLQTHPTTRGAIAAIVEGRASVGVLPSPEDDDHEPWWPTLERSGENKYRIVAKLPFAPARSGRTERREALVVGRITHDPSGADHSYVLIDAGRGMSRASVSAAFAKAGLVPCFLTSHDGTRDPATTQFLVEIPDYVAETDPRLDTVRSALGAGAETVIVVGGFAAPFVPGEMAGPIRGRGGA